MEKSYPVLKVGSSFKIPQKTEGVYRVIPANGTVFAVFFVTFQLGHTVARLQFLELFAFHLPGYRDSPTALANVEVPPREKKTERWKLDIFEVICFLLIFLGGKGLDSDFPIAFFSVFFKTGFFVEACNQQRHLVDFCETKNSSQKRHKLWHKENVRREISEVSWASLPFLVTKKNCTCRRFKLQISRSFFSSLEMIGLGMTTRDPGKLKYLSTVCVGLTPPTKDAIVTIRINPWQFLGWSFVNNDLNCYSVGVDPTYVAL